MRRGQPGVPDTSHHPLAPLLRPRSVAVAGASDRADSMGWWALENLQRGGFEGTVYPVNPKRDVVRGLRCYSRIADLPGVPELLIFAVGDERVEQVLDDAIAAGIPAVVIMSALAVSGDDGLRERVREKIGAAGMLACGANGMGFYNVRDRVWACGFDSSFHEPPGNVALISHSGAGMSGLVDSEERLQVNLAVSTGNELGVTMDRYLDYALDLPETRAVGLFVETSRNPAGFRAALDKAVRRNIPVVALKVGRTEESARLTVSHSGAMAGDSAAYDALFDRYGVHVVRDMDELATLLILFAHMHPVGPGGLVSLHDSGGERQLMIDLADAAGVPLTRLRPATVRALESVLDPELPAVNPLDGWSRGGSRAADKMKESLALMLEDRGAALGVVAHDRAPGGGIYRSYVDYMEVAHAASGKPVALVAARQGSGGDPFVVETTHRGFPVLDGLPAFLRGVRALFEQRDFQARQDGASPPQAPEPAVTDWRGKLAGLGVADEATSMAVLSDFGLPANPGRIVEGEPGLQAAAAELGYPLVLKTAMPGISHKTDSGGVCLDLRDAAALRAAADELAARCGPRMLLAPMLGPGVEMFLGARRDPQFGPVVLLGFGGVHAEVLHDVMYALPPFTRDDARRLVDRLELRPLLDGARGRPAADVDAFCDMAARFSAMVHALGDAVAEIDVNPVIVFESGCIAADALFVSAAGERT